jgi:hypothetical protein
MPNASNINEYPVLSLDEAPPSPPGPYCVFELSQPTTLSKSAGPAPKTEHHVEAARLTFMIHAAGNTRESGKKQCVRLGRRVMLTFDDSILDIYPAKQISISREPDFFTKEDEEDWSLTVPYLISWDIVVSTIPNDDIAPHGTWSIYKGVKTQWDSESLDSFFKNMWG